MKFTGLVIIDIVGIVGIVGIVNYLATNSIWKFIFVRDIPLSDPTGAISTRFFLNNKYFLCTAHRTPAGQDLRQVTMAIDITWSQIQTYRLISIDSIILV